MVVKESRALNTRAVDRETRFHRKGKLSTCSRSFPGAARKSRAACKALFEVAKGPSVPPEEWAGPPPGPGIVAIGGDIEYAGAAGPLRRRVIARRLVCEHLQPGSAASKDEQQGHRKQVDGLHGERPSRREHRQGRRILPGIAVDFDFAFAVIGDTQFIAGQIVADDGLADLFAQEYVVLVLLKIATPHDQGSALGTQRRQALLSCCPIAQRCNR